MNEKVKSDRKVTISNEIWIMKDGTGLFTRIIKPVTENNKFPTVFMRTPYDNNVAADDAVYTVYENDAFIKRGFAVVLQHCRGRGGSDGKCVPYSDKERSDGAESFEKIRSLDHYDGEIYLYGGSYTASVLMMISDHYKNDVKGVCFAFQTESMYHRNFFNGMNRSYSGFTWWLSMISRHLPKISSDEEIYVRPYKDIMRRAVGCDVKEFTDTLVNDRYNDFWRKDPRIALTDNLNVPVLLIGGWYDYYCYGMCKMWEKLKEDVREKSCFIMGPWGHGTHVPTDTDYVFPSGVIEEDIAPRWFDFIRNGELSDFGKWKTGLFNYYSVGEDKWHTAATPYGTAETLKFFLSGKDKLTTQDPVRYENGFVYDPEAPIKRDKYDYIFKAFKKGEYKDVLSFESLPFGEDVSFFGAAEVYLEVASDCDDTAFFARLYMVENGEAYNIADAISTILYFNGQYLRNERCEIKIYTQPVGFTIKKGCALRIDVSSGSDCFVPHANTAEHFAYEDKPRKAYNRVFSGNSYVSLPLSKKTK